MTTSYRQAIKDAVKAQLIGKTPAGSNVLTSLDRPLDPDKDLPAAMVYVMASRRGNQDYGQTVIPRVVMVGIEAATLAPAGQEIDAAEAFAEQIELAMEEDRSLGHVVNDCNWQQSISDATSHGRRTMGVCLLQYEVEILTHPKPDGFFEFGDDGFDAPPTLIKTRPGVPMPAGETLEGGCGPGGCDIPSWGGEQ